MAKILFFGDIMGKPGRHALAQVLPSLREEYSPDLVIANVENLAHGKGVTLPTLKELEDLGVDVFTSGNHVFDKAPQAKEAFEKYPQLIRPFNYDPSYPGSGYYSVAKNGQQFLVVNLGGRVFFENQFRGSIANPFFEADKLLEQESQKGDIIILDFHAEATSEKIALGRYLEGRITAFFGTHTHVPTADYQILPKGTSYVTDAGMTGPKDSVIGVETQNSLNMFLEKSKFIMDVAEKGPAMVNAPFRIC
jgi:metallophosphoesterase (TIGR00282 family)